MPCGAQKVDFLLMLTQNYIPVLLATGTAVVKNTFSTLDACCWKKKKNSHLWPLTYGRSPRTWSLPSSNGHSRGQKTLSVERFLHWVMFCLCSDMRSPHCLTFSSDNAASFVPHYLAVSQLPNPWLCVPKASSKVAFLKQSSKLSTLSYPPILLWGWKVFFPLPQGLSCMLRTG